MRLVALALLTLSSTAAAAPSMPKLFFEYSRLYDMNCAVTPERKIDPAWGKEAEEKTAYFRAVWERSGPILFGKVFELFGRGFSRKELTATLSVCPAASYSNPLVLNVLRYLKSFRGEKPIDSDDDFADLVFHELLHTWLVDNLEWPTPLLGKYAGEAPVVQSHLHLMAMQIYIYTELKRPDLLESIDRHYRNPKAPAYKRAWEIVADIEGSGVFIAEIRDSLASF